MPLRQLALVCILRQMVELARESGAAAVLLGLPKPGLVPRRPPDVSRAGR